MYVILFFLLATVVQQYIVNFINEAFVKPRINRHVIVCLYIIANLLQITVSRFFEDAFMAKLFFGWILLIIILCLCYRGSLKRKIMAFVTMLAVIFSADLITSQIYYLFSEEPLDVAFTYTVERSIIGFVCSILQIPFVYAIYKLQKRIKLNLRGKQWLFIAAIVLLQIMGISVYDILFYEMNQYMNVMVVFAGILFLLFDIWICKVIFMFEVKKETEESIENMTEWNRMMTDYYLDVSDKMNRLSDLGEMYENRMKAVYSLVGKEYESISYHKESKFPQCDNKIVNSIMKNVVMELERINCTFDIRLNIPNEIDMEIMDLSSVFINMFDNAICAVGKYMSEGMKDGRNEGRGASKGGNSACEQYQLRAEAEYKGGELIIEVTNLKSKSDKVRRINNNFITTKENKEAHGYGIQIIKRIAEKYGGSMDIEYDDDSFKNRVVMKI